MKTLSTNSISGRKTTAELDGERSNICFSGRTRIERYTETYLDDAMRLCQYIAGDDGVISIEPADPVMFPIPLKGQEFPEQLFAVRVSREGITVAECAYLTRRDDGEKDLKFRNRWLISLKLGDELRRARERSGLTLEDMAKRTGYSAHSVDAMERGRYNMDIKLLGRVADALGCDIVLSPRQN